jgi:hypothetical protein
MSIVTLNDRGVRSVTAFGSLNTGSMVFIKKLTASSSGTLSFVDGASSVVLDSTYKEYVFTFNNIHPQTDDVRFEFNMSTDGGSNYNQAQETGFQRIFLEQCGNDNDQNGGGYLHLFNPSSTTFLKHFICVTNHNQHNDYNNNGFLAGYGNTASAIDAIQFKMSSGNIDAGDICLYGIL